MGQKISFSCSLSCYISEYDRFTSSVMSGMQYEKLVVSVKILLKEFARNIRSILVDKHASSDFDVTSNWFNY